LILSIYGKGDSFDSLRENWYTFGESSAQVIIAFAAGVHGELNLAHAVAFWYFPHENWVSRRNKHFQQRSRILGVVLVLYYFLVPRSYYMTHVIIYHAVVYFTYYYCGAFFKRNPLPKHDFKTDIQKEMALKNSKVKDENFKQKFIAKVFSGESGAFKSGEKKRSPELSGKGLKVSLPSPELSETESEVSLPPSTPKFISPKREAKVESSTEVEVLRARVHELESQLETRIAFLEQQMIKRIENMNTSARAADPALPQASRSPSLSPIPSKWELSLSDAETASLDLIKAVSRATQSSNQVNKRFITVDTSKFSVDGLPQPAKNKSTVESHHSGDGMDSDHLPGSSLHFMPIDSLELLDKKSSLLLQERLSSLCLNGHTESSYILFVQNSASRQVTGGF